MKYSIIIPVYNCEKYILDCLESISMQSINNYEVIIINDGSKDNTEIIIKEYIKDKKNFKLYTTENKGVSHARNYGIKKSKGDYILFVDGDDLVTTNYLSTIDNLVDTIKNFDLIQTQLYEFYDLKNISFTNEPIKSKKLTKAELAKATGDLCSGLARRDNIINPGPVCKIYKSSIIKDNNIKFNEDFSVFEDGIFNVEYLIHCKNVYLNNQIMYLYRRSNSSSATHKFDNKFLDKRLIMINYVNSIVEKNKLTIDYYYRFCIESLLSVYHYYLFNNDNKNKSKKLFKDIKNIDCFKDAICNKKIVSNLIFKKSLIINLTKFNCYFLLNMLYKIKYKLNK